jgi:hypothetical protein
MVLLLATANYFYNGGLLLGGSSSSSSSSSDTASADSVHSAQNFAGQLLAELVDCERFSMVLTLSMIDHSDLRNQTKATLLHMTDTYEHANIHKFRCMI